MQKIYKFITQLVASAITDAPVDIKQEDIDYKAVFDLCESLDISPLVGYSLFKNNLVQDDEYKTHFRNVEMIALYRYMQGESELMSVGSAFDKEDIDYLPLKGSVITPYYPQKHLRTKSDIDILIKKEDVEKASAILKDTLGYEKGFVNDHDISFFSPGGFHIELHFSLSENNSDQDKLLEKVWDNAYPQGNTHRYLMNNDFFALYHIIHMAKHFINGGCGVKPIIDLWIIQNKMGYDEDKLTDNLQKCNLVTFYTEMKKLSKVWFENVPHTDATKKIEDFLFGSGAYGTMENHIAIRQLKEGGKSGYLLSKIFLSYKDMLVYYPSLKGHPSLYPFYQIRRWFKIAFCGGATVAKEQLKQNKNMSENKQKQVSELINILGI